jgi:hypothetical protein
MTEYKENFNQMVLRAARGNKATAIVKAFLGNDGKKKQDENQEH